MELEYIDLRSDTVTQQPQKMRDAMMRAAVGDDVFGDDPTVNELENLAAQMLGKEAALFVTSGTQGNACAVMSQTRRGDCIVIDPHAHIAEHEAGSYALLSGVSLRHPENAGGVMNPESVRTCITDDAELQVARTGLVVLENAHSLGTVIPLENMQAIYEIAKEKKVPVHLDGARVFNAAAALGVSDVRELTQYCDTVMCCLSKGLCAPVGSVLAGPAETIRRARKVRKLLGGGLRQAGFLAAAGRIALTEMTDRLTEDHENAKYLGLQLSLIDGITVAMDRIQIDMVFWKADWSAEKAAGFTDFMLEHGVKVTGCENGEYRMVTHWGIGQADCDRVAALVREYAAE